MEKVIIRWERVNGSHRRSTEWLFKDMLNASRFFEQMEQRGRKLKQTFASIDMGLEQDDNKD